MFGGGRSYRQKPGGEIALLYYLIYKRPVGLRQVVFFNKIINKDMKESKLTTRVHPLPPGLADIITPVTIYLKIRDKFPNTILLESSDYHGNSNSMSYVCFDVMSEFKVEDYRIDITYPSGQREKTEIKDR